MGIKRLLAAALCAVIMLGALVSLVMRPAPAEGAPSAQDPRPSIAQPEPDAAVRGAVQVIGTATHPQFQRYELYYAPWPVPSDQAWVFIGDAKFQQQPLGLLGMWDTRAIPDGAYALRVRVVKQDGNYLDSDPVRVLVANTRPVETPTAEPTATATVEAAPVVTEPTAAAPEAVAPTVEVILPTTGPTETPGEIETATPEPEGSETPVASAEDDGDMGGLSLDRLASVAERTAKYTVGLFVAVGAFFALKAALFWLWQRLRP